MTNEKIAQYLDAHERAAVQEPNGSDEILDLADRIYARYLLGMAPRAADSQALLWVLRHGALAGLKGVQAPLKVHLTAYVLGAANLLAEGGSGTQMDAAIAGRDWDLNLILDSKHLPRWPWYFSHHSWRVSHWIGGAPSILRSLWRRIPDRSRELGFPTVGTVLDACDRLVDERTGLLRAYRSTLLQLAFRNLYRLRHDPDAGDVGGIVHLHWVNYAEGRMPYRGNEALHRRAWAVMQKAPFLEETPYCLDFDIVQIVRTSAKEPFPHAIRLRAERYLDDLVRFFDAGLSDGYRLHRLPGALATMHECAMLTGNTSVAGLSIPPIDIIKAANWI
jgi:hypothetical protein